MWKLLFLPIFFLGCSTSVEITKKDILNESFAFMGSSTVIDYGLPQQVKFAKKDAFDNLYKKITKDYSVPNQFISFAIKNNVKEHYWVENKIVYYGILLNQDNFEKLLNNYENNIKRR